MTIPELINRIIIFVHRIFKVIRKDRVTQSHLKCIIERVLTIMLTMGKPKDWLYPPRARIIVQRGNHFFKGIE